MARMKPRLDQRPATLLRRPNATKTATLSSAVSTNSRRSGRSPRATYDKRERIYQGHIDVASIRIWPHNPRHLIHGTGASRHVVRGTHGFRPTQRASA